MTQEHCCDVYLLHNYVLLRHSFLLPKLKQKLSKKLLALFALRKLLGAHYLYFDLGLQYL